MGGSDSNLNGILEFWDVDEHQSMSIQEHFKCTHVEWDPSGRVVMSSVCQPIHNFNAKYTMDNGYHLWSFQGKLLLEVRRDHFYQFLWRPRPKSLLTDAEYKDVVKNLKKYEKRFHELDKQREQERLASEAAERKAMVEAFRERLSSRREAARQRRRAYVALLDGFDSEDEATFVVQTVARDEIVSQTEHKMNGNAKGGY
jgi:translation initiation factor 3 subunit B